MQQEIVTLADIYRARNMLQGIIHRTPLEYSAGYSEITGNAVYLKLENLQKTGSFKIRGAYNKITTLTHEERRQGVIAASAGNHAQGVAFAASKAGIDSTVIMPLGAPLAKVEATRGYGAEIILAGDNYDEAYKRAKEIQIDKGGIFLHAFDDPMVIAGQGTVGLEIIDELPKLDAVVVPIGGGGLISGIALALKAIKPEVRIFGVQAAGAPSASVSREAGTIKEIKDVRTIADGIAVKRPGDLTFQLIQKYVEKIVTVEDEDTAQAILSMLEKNKLVTEGSGAIALAALLTNKIPLKNANIAVVISGGNVDVHFISIIIERGLLRKGRYVRLQTQISDRPGALQKLLSIIAQNRANVIAVHHDRISPMVPLTQTELEVALETRNTEHIEQIIQALSQEGYQVKLV